MLIDWFTVAAQILNFLLLVWLMKRFLYKPILAAVDAREKLIAAELADAAANKCEALKERDEFHRKNEEFEKQRSALISRAISEAKIEGDRILTKAKEDAAATGAMILENYRNDTDKLSHSLCRRVQDEVFSIARKLLAELADADLEERMADSFVRRLLSVDAKTKDTIVKDFNSAPGQVTVRSAFLLSSPQRANIQNALNLFFSAAVSIRFETAPDVISGIELSTKGQKISWSISDYLVSLEKSVDELFSNQTTVTSINPDRAESLPLEKGIGNENCA
jgi:F-type H+-transporting ATPase subunit b